MSQHVCPSFERVCADTSTPCPTRGCVPALGRRLGAPARPFKFSTKSSRNFDGGLRSQRTRRTAAGMPGAMPGSRRAGKSRPVCTYRLRFVISARRQFLGSWLPRSQPLRVRSMSVRCAACWQSASRCRRTTVNLLLGPKTGVWERVSSSVGSVFFSDARQANTPHGQPRSPYLPRIGTWSRLTADATETGGVSDRKALTALGAPRESVGVSAAGSTISAFLVLSFCAKSK
jgi:hypothetical protein